MAEESSSLYAGTQNKVVSFINGELGEDITQLSKASKLLEKARAKKLELENKLSSARKGDGGISQSLNKAESSLKKIEDLLQKQQQAAKDIADHLEKAQPVVEQLVSLSSKVQQLERYVYYLEWILQVDEINSSIQAALLIKAEERCVKHYAQLAELSKTIAGSSCCHLVKFVNDTLMFWFKIILEKFGGEFEEILKAFNWPFITSNILKQLPQPSKEHVAELHAKLDSLFGSLLQLQLPEHLIAEDPIVAIIPEWRPLPLPLQLLLKPLRKRFKFHFCGKKLTNNIEKPEWYMTQVLSWIRDHSGFLKKRIQPLMDRAGLKYMDAVGEFSRGLMQLALEKLAADLPMIEDDVVFSHTVDETLLFNRELRSAGGAAATPGCLHVLCGDTIFDRWLTLENKFAAEKMDALLESESAWRLQYGDNMADVDDLMVPECTEAFMTVMLLITDRYSSLPYASHKMRFFELQLTLLEDFRIRLTQLMRDKHPLHASYCSILNAVNYIILVLKDWSDLPVFLQMQFYKVQYESFQASQHLESASDVAMETDADISDAASQPISPIVPRFQLSEVFQDFDPSKLDFIEGSIFDETIKLLEHIRNEMLRNIVETTVYDIKAKSRPYRNNRDRLHLMEQQLCRPLFDEAWQKLAEHLNKFFFEELILMNNFNEGGAAQLQYDMTRGLFPLFGDYTQRPENYFKDVKEACTLLTLKPGSAMLLSEVLAVVVHGGGGGDDDDDRTKRADPIAALHEGAIYRLGCDEAYRVLHLRTDLQP
ncbi:PREDICTED: RAD50-interacting protein 1-like isoform X2 [Priapulus caudatus]|uniref:RAD50-interacting protein 1-like isoform X2 n=1 Tax=Priapulus caudatus TaxID=37621 RepID=A0ABM1F9Y5_PRICU|nr:PREDICTED: RAD50-interacting protein 1-like isoform X2 [Priapulus caudatus]